MANERKMILHPSGQQALTTSGASLTSGGTPALAANFNLASFNDYPHLLFVLRCQWATATSIENKVIELLGRRKNVQSTNHEEAPTATFRPQYGIFVPRGVANATNLYMSCEVYDAPKDCDWYIYNLTDQTISANWGMWVTPFTNGT